MAGKGPDLTIDPSAVLEEGVALIGPARSRISIGPRCRLKRGVVLNTYGGSIVLGARVSIGEYSVVYGHGGVTIEDAVIVGPHAMIASSSHILGSAVPCRFAGETTRGVRVESGVWLGARVTVLDGVTLGARSAVGAGAVVTRSIPPGWLAVGVPARCVREIARSPLYGLSEQRTDSEASNASADRRTER